MKSDQPSPVPGVSPSSSPLDRGPDGTFPPNRGIQSDLLGMEEEDDEVLVFSQPTNPIRVALSMPVQRRATMTNLRN